MYNYSFSQDYNDNPHSDWNDHNFDCSDHYLNPVIDNQMLIQVDENDTNSKSQLNVTNKTKLQKKKLKFNFSKRKKIELQNYNQKHHSIIKKRNNIDTPNSLFHKKGCESNEILSQNTDISSKMTTLSSIKWKFDFIATLIKQTKLEMIQLQKYRNDNQQL
ncbi:unnamed protein product [Paramecium primaurelia]|uniref:Uncharacterized protein n=1 Tax=Paramecium primaurelia TaxID=5886 RepID=A0A8S1M3L9_PARPR|nr:unnamed protein product [Paramecium primaurelia]